MKLFEIGFITVTLKDILDIGIVTFIFFKLYEMLKGSVALRLLGVVFSIFLIWKVVGLLQFRLLKSILDAFLDLGAIALVIIFAPEIRRFLSVISKNPLVERLIRHATAPATRSDSAEVYLEVVEAIKDIRATGNGALIVVTGKNDLSDIQETGDQINADISARLIYTIFQKQSPLHDGAMILHNQKIASVRCILPISKRTDISPEFGMRHRAALGLTEVSDALVIVVSEERREVSLAYEGELRKNVEYDDIIEAIISHTRQTISFTMLNK
ncbi:MAG: TIGR00159 family protein [Bacteroidetes bacterium]|nr:MAG: TIGR00159 family protein [Bacteroidota bacterium]